MSNRKTGPPRRGPEDDADELNEILEIASSTSELGKKQLNIFYLTLRHGIRGMEARLAWCEEVIALLSGKGVVEATNTRAKSGELMRESTTVTAPADRFTEARMRLATEVVRSRQSSSSLCELTLLGVVRLILGR